MKSLAFCTTAVLALSLGTPPAGYAQSSTLTVDGAATDIEDIRRPRLAFAADGSFAVAAEVLTLTSQSRSVLKIAVRRFTATGVPVGPWHLFEGESCSGIDIWTSDYMSHAEIAFRTDGNLIVLMQHSGRFHIGGDDVGSAEVTIGAIDASGQIIDLNASGSCLQQKLIFVGGSRQDRPRMAVAPNGGMLVTADGFFNQSTLRNVAVRVLDGSLAELLEQAIPHTDAQSEQAFHMNPDIATNGSLGLSVWQRCPIIDAQGNAAECDIDAQFFSSPISSSPVAVGGNVTVTSGDPPGTISIWPAASMNASGASVVAWADTRTSATGDIFGQRFDASGQPVGDNFQISATEGVIYDRPEVSILPDGRFMVAWTDSSSLGFQARARPYDASGQPLGPPFRFVNDAGIQTGYPAIAVSGSGFEAIWLAGQTGEVPGLYTTHADQIVTDASPTVRPQAAFLPNAPNPFTDRTTLSFTLQRPGPVRLSVYDATGRELAVLVDRVLPAGTHAVSWDGTGVPVGVYLARLSADGATMTRALVRAR